MARRHHDWMETVRMICFAANAAALIWLALLVLTGYVR